MIGALQVIVPLIRQDERPRATTPGAKGYIRIPAEPMTARAPGGSARRTVTLVTMRGASTTMAIPMTAALSAIRAAVSRPLW